MRNARLFLVAGFFLVAGGSLATVPHLLAQSAPPAGAQGRPPQGGPPSMGGGNELVEALKASKGCLGVETAFTQTRKATIFAWFESKKAVLDWYESDFHQTAMMQLKEGAEAAGSDGSSTYKPDEHAGEADEREPLAYIKDDVGPILCIATITPSMKQLVPGFDSPISQISIELYAPLPGGIAFNGKLAPASLKIPHMIELTPPPAGQ